MKLLSIDPASAKPHGVAGFANKDLFLVSHMSTDDIYDLLRLNDGWEVVCVEDQYFHRNVKTLAKLSRATGGLELIARMTGVKFFWVNPALWQKHFKITARGKEKNAAYVELAISLYPSVRGLSVDEACAILIGRYFLDVGREHEV